jgi:rhamnogalacturonan endolyase
VTTAYANGRPQVVVNDTWTSAVPSPPTQPSTRSLTVGSYRGNNNTFTYSVPASAWLTDASAYNTLKIYVASGSGTTSFLEAVPVRRSTRSICWRTSGDQDMDIVVVVGKLNGSQT